MLNVRFLQDNRLIDALQLPMVPRKGEMVSFDFQPGSYTVTNVIYRLDMDRDGDKRIYSTVEVHVEQS